jgi:light-regulated signal transduction histidine kinase (bacteriophytochrome)
MPRGITSLEKRLTTEDIQRLKIEGALKMVKEGLSHTQRVYKSVYEFTNLVKQNVVLNKTLVNTKDLIWKYISPNSYSSQVEISDLSEMEVNETLFCNAVENLIKNGLSYNDSEVKKVKIYNEEEYLIVEDNGRGFSQKDFEKHLTKYSKKADVTGDEKGLGLNICVAILEEHGFKLTCEKIDTGTKMKIKIKEEKHD